MAPENTYRLPLPRKVNIGQLIIGGGEPVVIQSMANTPTMDLGASLAQFQRIVSAGGQMVRFSTPGIRDVEALKNIVQKVKKSHPEIPVVADVHFQAKIAFLAAESCHKVRINPGNFHEKKLSFIEFNEEAYNESLKAAKEKLLSLIDICTLKNTALRIGVNHGSLSSRIMSKYGDSPEGMVESAMEYVRICHCAGFHKLLVSLKSSNTVLMVKAVRLLTKRMLQEDMYYPLHLGVTESGNGAEGRIRSVCGMAPLLMEGIGDTLRVSLTEPPEDEIPVARMLQELFPKPQSLPYDPLELSHVDPFQFVKIPLRRVFGLGEGPPIVVSSAISKNDPEADIIASVNEEGFIFETKDFSFPVTPMQTGDKGHGQDQTKERAYLITTMHSPRLVAREDGSVLWVLDTLSAEPFMIKKWLLSYYNAGGKNPLILKRSYQENDWERYIMKSSGELSLLLVDHLVSGIWLINDFFPAEKNIWLSFQVLQASRNRFTSTEYIACPSCGRTLFDIETVLNRVKESTSHLRGLTIAVMGCIVNGPGEMADADYGYIGAGKGLVSIYKGKKEVLKKVSEEKAVQELIRVIKEHGDWQEP